MQAFPFASVAIAGLGLIGGSIALAIRERWPAIRVVGVDRAAVIAHALGSGAIERSAASLAEVGDVELIVLAAPIRQNIELVAQIARTAGARTVVTDVGGTKREIVDAARALGESVAFVGGHPIGGAERGGFAFARPDLFEGRPWIFTPAGGTDASAPAEGPAPLDRLFELVRGLGAKPAVMDAAAHDRLMAFLSHLPQLTVSALMAAIGRGAGRDGLAFAGRGLTDSTRLASSPADVWRDICTTNADAIGDALDELIATLTELRADLERGGTLETIFEEAARWRAELMKDRG